MTDVTTVDVAALVSAAARCEEAAAGLRATLGGLLDRLADCRELWRGGGGGAFAEARQAWADDQETLVGALAGMGATLRVTAVRYAAADDGAAARIVAAGGPARLPRLPSGNRA